MNLFQKELHWLLLIPKPINIFAIIPNDEYESSSISLTHVSLLSLIKAQVTLYSAPSSSQLFLLPSDF